LDEQLKDAYVKYLDEYKVKHPKKGFIQEFMNPTPPPPEFTVDNSLINKEAEDNNIALVTIGRNAGEGRDRKVENDFDLSNAEKTLIQSVADAFHAKNKKVVVVLNIGGVIEIASWRNNADAILLAWQPGLEAGNAVADIIGGKMNPSGKLATTFPMKYEDVPSAKNFPGKEFPDKATTGGFGMRQIPGEVTYEEGIYVGYRYYNTFNVKPAYEFGYGLSYTDFKYSNFSISKTFSDKITATVTITNTGKVAGKEVVQLYVSAPSGKLDKPAEELKAFAKTNLLQPGQSQEISLVVNVADLASFNTDLTSWIADAGTYKVKVGSSSLNIKQTADLTLPKELVVEKCNKVMTPPVQINELTKRPF
jgi:beta-glucosidase